MFESKNYNRLRTSLSVNKLDLDGELERHPFNLMETCEYAAQAISVRDAAKLALEVKRAEAGRAIRNEGARKPAEAQVESETLLDEGVKDATQEFEEAKFEASLWMSMVDAMKAKSSALKHISELIASGYMSTGSAHSEARQQIARRRLSKTEG